MASGQHMRFQPMKSNAMSHNHRLKVPSYVVSEKTELNVVYVQTSKRNLTDYTKAVKADYEKHHGQKYQDKMNPLWETLIVVNPETTDEAIHEAIKLIERETGLKIVDAVRHKDEGHFKGDEWIPNEHVHLIAERYNFETHKHVTLDVKQIRELRLKVANTLGIAYTQTKEGEKPKKNVSHHKFREEAQAAQIKELEAKIEGIPETIEGYDFRTVQQFISALPIDPSEKKDIHGLNNALKRSIRVGGGSEELKTLSERLRVISERESAQKKKLNELAVKIKAIPAPPPAPYSFEVIMPVIENRFEEIEAERAKERAKYEATITEERSEKEGYADKLAEIHHAYDKEPSQVQPILDRQAEELKTAKPAYKTALQRRDEAYRERIGRDPKPKYTGPRLR